MYKKYKDKNYEFMYYQTSYDNITTPYTEYKRNIIWGEITDKIMEVLKINNVVLRSSNKKPRVILLNNLAMYICRNLMEEKHLVDPFFPYKAKHNDVLVENFIDNGNISEKKAKELVQKINLPKLCTNACVKIKELDHQEDYQIIKVKDGLKIVSEKFVKFVFCPNYIYNKLVKNYNGKKEDFDSIVFCLMLRYETLAGRSHQFAMETKFKDALEKTYNCYVECFASSINFYYPTYCSLFYDIEKYFGSIGSFYNVEYTKGFFLANPPYESDMLLKMVEKFENSIESTKESLAISFGMPKWGAYRKFDAIEKAEKSKYNTFYRCLNREVYWTDTLTNYKIIIPEHCRFVFQNKKGEKKYDINQMSYLIDNYWISPNLDKLNPNIKNKTGRLASDFNINSVDLYYKKETTFMKYQIKNHSFPSIFSIYNFKQLSKKIEEYQKFSHKFKKEYKQIEKFRLDKNLQHVLVFDEKNSYNDIIYYYSEKEINDCSFDNYRSFNTNFKYYGDFLYRELDKIEKNSNIETQREYLYSKIPTCFSLNTEFCLSILDYFSPKSVLDYNCIFGEKLLSCAIKKIKYLGFDSSKNKITNVYNKIIEDFGNSKKQLVINSDCKTYPDVFVREKLKDINLTKVSMIYTKIKNYKLHSIKGTKDTVENYSSNKEKYLVFSVFYSLIKYMRFLEHKGLVILEFESIDYIEPLVFFVLLNFHIFNLSYTGFINNNDKPCIIFNRTISYNNVDKKTILNKFQKNYPLVFSLSKNLINLKEDNFFLEIDPRTEEEGKIIIDSGKNSSQNRTIFKVFLSLENWIKDIKFFGGMKASEQLVIVTKFANLLNLKFSFVINKYETGWKAEGDYLNRFYITPGEPWKKAATLGMKQEFIEENNLYYSSINVLKNSLDEKYKKDFKVKIFPFNILENHINILTDSIRERFSQIDIDPDTYEGTIYIAINTSDYLICLMRIFKKCFFEVCLTGAEINRDLIDLNRVNLFRTGSLNGKVYSYNTGPPEIEKIAQKFDTEIFSGWIYFHYLKNRKKKDICIFYD